VGDAALDRHGPQALERPECTRRIALLDLRQRLLGADLVGQRLAGDLGGQGERRRRPPVPQGLEGVAAQGQTLDLPRLMLEEDVEVAQRLAEGAHLDRPPGGLEQPRCRLVRAASLEPVRGDERGRGPARDEPPGGIAVHGDPVVRRDLLGEGDPDEIVPEAVAALGDDERTRVEGRVEQGERVGLCQAGQGQHARDVEVIAGHGQAAQHPQRGLVEIEEPRRDRVPD
jgi:hypothetical protein